MNFDKVEGRLVLVPAGNKDRSIELWKPLPKLKNGNVKKDEEPEANLANKFPSPVGLKSNCGRAISILRQGQPNLSMSASCSSDASSDSSHSRASTGRINRGRGERKTVVKRKQHWSSNGEKVQQSVGAEIEGVVVDGTLAKKRCAWVTPHTDPSYVAFHDEEWGIPVHNDKNLFELLSFSTALAELTWPVILSKRHIFREVFLDFDPIQVSNLNEKRIASTGSPASLLLSELKLRAIIENARQICKIIDDLGSFDKYIWSFVNFKPISGNFRYPRQVPIKTSKADTISKDLVRRGFRGVGPTAVYSFMQVAGLTNDHLINCFRYQDCVAAGDSKLQDERLNTMNELKRIENVNATELGVAIDDLSIIT